MFGVPAAAIFSASSAVLVPVYALMAFAPASKLVRGDMHLCGGGW